VLLDAVRRVAAGGSAFDPEVIARLAGLRAVPPPDPLDQLTPREREVLGLMAQGMSNSGIAERLFVTIPAVERHVTGILAKLAKGPCPRQHRRVLAILEYLRGGQAPPAASSLLTQDTSGRDGL
jgi:DNA-binding NarL/FixJ family response regulator